jgi:hypothetical protein
MMAVRGRTIKFANSPPRQHWTKAFVFEGRHFDDVVDVRSNTTAALKAIPQNQFQNCVDGRTRRWHRRIASQGEYFEGDHGGIQQ